MQILSRCKLFQWVWARVSTKVSMIYINDIGLYHDTIMIFSCEYIIIYINIYINIKSFFTFTIFGRPLVKRFAL